MRRNAIFIDTWGWLTLGDPQEPRHNEITRFYRGTEDNHVTIRTSDYVISELVTLLFRRVPFDKAASFVDGILSAAVRGQIQIEPVTSSRFMTAWELKKRFKDKPKISFTDLISMAIMAELGIQQVLTEDAHFTHVGMDFARVP